jgi:Uma2 family endonuclease
MSYSATDSRRRRLTVQDYTRMEEVGILGPEERVELIDGAIIAMPPIGSVHASSVLKLDHLLQSAVRGQALVLVQSSIVLDDYNAPQPDLALLKMRADFYRSGLPGPSDVLLVVEVAQSSLRYDRGVKLPLYAQYRIPEYWLIDEVSQRLIRHRAPLERSYARTDEPDLAKPVDIELLPSVRLDLSEFFGSSGN